MLAVSLYLNTIWDFSPFLLRSDHASCTELSRTRTDILNGLEVD